MGGILAPRSPRTGPGQAAGAALITTNTPAVTKVPAMRLPLSAPLRALSCASSSYGQLFQVDETVEDLDRSRPHDDHEEGRQHAQDEREDDLHGGLLRLGLDRLTSFDPELSGLRPQ